MFEIRFSIWAWNSVEEVNYWRVFVIIIVQTLIFEFLILSNFPIGIKIKYKLIADLSIDWD